MIDSSMLRISDRNGSIEIVLAGQIDSTGTAMLRQSFVSLSHVGEGDLILDMTAVTMIDGSMIGAISYLFKRMRGTGRSISVVGASGQPLNLLRQLGIGALLGEARPSEPERRSPRAHFSRGSFARRAAG